MKKLLRIVAGLVVAVLLLAVVGVTLFLDPLLRREVESSTSAALRVPTRLDGASVHWTGDATLGRFEASNPAGFSEPRSVAFDRIEVSVPPRELFSDVVHVDQLLISRPEVTLEFAGAKNNLSALIDNLSAGREPGAGPGKKFLVRKLRIEAATVRFRSDLLGGKDQSVMLPTLELENVGTAEGGASMGMLLREILQTLAAAAVKAGDGVIPANLLENLRSGIRDLPGRAEQELRKRAEELKSKDLDPAGIEKKLKDRLERKTAD